MSLGTIGYWIIESLEGIKKNSKTFFVGLGTMIIVLCLIGGLYVVYLNANSFMGDIKQNESKVNLYVKDLEENDVSSILTRLYGIDGISDVTYISEKEAYEIAKEKMGEEMVEGIEPEGVFPASFVITIEGTGSGSIAPIKNQVYAISKLYQSLIGDDGFGQAEITIKIAISVKAITITILTLCTILGCSLMMNSIKLALYARRKEIEIMKYVGATDRYVRAPFIIEGLIIAIIAAICTMIITNIIYGGVINAVGKGILFDFLVAKEEVLSSLWILLFAVSIGIGTIGSSMSINKYLDV